MCHLERVVLFAASFQRASHAVPHVEIGRRHIGRQYGCCLGTRTQKNNKPIPFEEQDITNAGKYSANIEQKDVRGNSNEWINSSRRPREKSSRRMQEQYRIYGCR
ncbi:uncharacterized protein CBL_09567 [Carabus blaptoides fortunei]